MKALIMALALILVGSEQYVDGLELVAAWMSA